MRDFLRHAVTLAIFTIPACSQPQDPAALESLYQQQKWFELRQAVEGRQDTPLRYEAAIEYAFNRPDAEADLLKLISSIPDKREQDQVRNQFLVQYYNLRGLYKKSAAQIKITISNNRSSPETQEFQRFVEFYEGQADQRVISRSPTSIKFKFRRIPGIEGVAISVPLTVNGIQVNYPLDSGSSVSYVSASEARMLGMKIHQTQQMTLAGSGPMEYGSAIAERLTIGGIVLKNVEFGVAPDSVFPYNRLGEKQRGMLGIPVLLALRHFEWNPATSVLKTLHVANSPGNEPSNLAFGTGNLFIRAEIYKHPVTLFWDTGLGPSGITSSCEAYLPDILARETFHKCLSSSGGGDAASLCRAIEGVHVRLGEAESSVRVLSFKSNSQPCGGSLGMDLLSDGHTVEVNFDTMTLLRR